MKLIAAMLVVFLGVVAVGEAFQCFNCNSLMNPGCEDPFDPSKHADFKQDCLLTSTCMKAVTGDTVVRSCLVGDVCASSYECQGDTCAYCCKGDSCNSAGTVGFNFAMAAAGLVLTRMFY